jgi:formate hydrogenlyase subunit 3/multisubunit Na+/H+ antiporter MnhD subunit
VSHFQTGAAIRAAYKYFIMIHAGALCLLAAIIAIYLNVGELSMPALGGLGGLSVTHPGVWLTIVMILTFVAFAVKAAVVPLHTWLPRAHPEAPSPISALLSGIMIKTGIYGLVRFFFGVYGISFDGSTWGLIIATLGIITMMVAIHMALIERDIKKFLAFSSISHIGFVILGIGIGTAIGIAGGLFHLFNHAILKALLFLCAGSIIYRVGTRNVDEMGGLAKRMPLTAGFFIIAALAISGVPPFNGFASKLLIYQASLTSGGPFGHIYMIYCFLAIYVSAVTLVAFMKVAHGAFFGQMPERFRRVRESPKSMTLPLGILAATCIVLGVLPLLPLKYLIIPEMEAVGLGAVQGLTTGWLGYTTSIGFYQVAALALLISASFAGGALIYFTGIRSAPRAPSPEKYKVMTGGEEAPSLTPEEIRTPSATFSHTVRGALKPLFKVADRGGFDLLWNGLAGGVKRLSYGFHRRLLTAGFVPVLLLLIALGALISLFLIRGII